MKKPVALSILFILNLFFISTHAQIKLTTTDVKEIWIHDIAGWLGGDVSTDIKVVAEANQWHSYLVRKSCYNTDFEGKSYDSVMYRSIALLSPALLDDLLKGIAVIKPAITPATFGLTPDTLISELMKNAKQPVNGVPDFKKLITQEIINEAIAKTIVEINPMDLLVECDVKIISRNNDTVKLTATRWCPTKLPWEINKIDTYDMAINDFVVAAVGPENTPNKESLGMAPLEEAIFKYIDEQRPGAPIATFRRKNNR